MGIVIIIERAKNFQSKKIYIIFIKREITT